MNVESRNRLPERPERAVAMRQGSAARITRSLLGHVNAIAEACGAVAVFVYVDALEGQALPLDEEIGPKADIWRYSAACYGARGRIWKGRRLWRGEASRRTRSCSTGSTA